MHTTETLTDRLRSVLSERVTDVDVLAVFTLGDDVAVVTMERVGDTHTHFAVRDGSGTAMSTSVTSWDPAVFTDSAEAMAFALRHTGWAQALA